MGHPDEHTLELFAVGSLRIGESASAIREHCNHCPHCRRIVEEKRDYYARVGTLLEENIEVAPEKSKFVPGSALPTRRPAYPDFPPLSEERLPFHQDAFRFIRRHPVASSGGFLAGLALLGWLIMSPTRSPAIDPNPNAVRMNFQTGCAEVFNKDGKLLWSKPLQSPRSVEQEFNRGVKNAVVVDLNGTGHRNVAFAIPLVGFGSEARTYPYVTMFSETGSVIADLPLGHEVTYGSRIYRNQFSAAGLTAFPLSGPGPQVLAVTASHFRSPVAITVIGEGRAIKGEYWHYGHMSTATTIPGLLGRPQGAVLVVGSNDAADSVGIRYIVAAVLDPSRIEGRVESQLTRGFGYPTTAAELMYLRIPEVDVANALGESLEPLRLTYVGNRELTVLFRTASFGIDYVFSKDMEVLSARPLPEFAEIHARLRKQGKIHSTFDEKYIEALRSGVRYWDGGKWRREVVGIRQQAIGNRQWAVGSRQQAVGNRQ